MAEAVDKGRLLELLEPAVAAMGFELADLDAHFGRRGLLRLYIDREGGVTLDDCQRVSEQIGAFLDVEDPLPGSYVLEVSSPGVERPLLKPADWQRFAGRKAKVLSDALGGREEVEIVALEGNTGAEIVVVRDGRGAERRVPLAQVREARLAFHW